MDLVPLLRELSQAHGVSGHEEAVRAVARQAFAPYVDELHEDALGNLIALRRGQPHGSAPRRAIMLAAHTDEIGLMVTGYEGAFLRFTRVGGVDLRLILGREVVVHGSRALPGIIASRPPHVLSRAEMSKPVPIDELYIDVGLEAEALRQAVQVGDVVTFAGQFLELTEGYVAGKALDDRAGVASLAVCLEQLAGLRHAWDVCAVATSQEEVGLRGAMVSAYGLAPDAAVAVDVGFGAQPGLAEHEKLNMNAGPAIAKGPNVHPLLHERLLATAKEQEMPHQQEYLSGASGTDAWAIQVAREGIPTALLSVPTRYMHSTVETVCVQDVQRTGRLLALLIAGLDEAFAARLSGQEGEQG